MGAELQKTEAIASPPKTLQVGSPERQPHPIDFATTLFRLLEEFGLRYCLLKGPEAKTSALVSHLEMTVHSEDCVRLPLLLKKLREEGYLPLQCLPLAANDCRYDFASSLDAGLHFFSLTIREAFPRGQLFATDGEILTRRQKHGNCWVACEADEFCYLLSKVSLEGRVTEHQQGRLKQLAEALGPSQAERVAAQLFGNGLHQEVVAACAGGQLAGILERLGAQLRRTSLRRASLGWFVHALLRFRCALRRWLGPSGVYIVLLGPDGAGKSTLTNKFLELLGPLFDHSRVFQWRPQVIKPRPRYFPTFNPPHTKPPYGSMRSAVHILAVFADYCLGYATVIRPLLARTALLIYDRDFHDLLVDRLRYRYGGPHWIPRVAVRLSPKPETVYLTLDAEPDIILQRKNEVAPEELRRQRGAYLKLAAQLPNSTVVRTDQGPEASTSAATRAVLTWMASRFEHRQRRLLLRAAEQTNGHRAAPQTPPSHIPSFYSLAGRLIDFCAGWTSWLLKSCMAVLDQGLISGSNFLLGILLARYLGAGQYGAYALAFSTFLLLALIHQALLLEPMSVFGPSVYRNPLRRYLGLLLWLQLAVGVITVIGVGSTGALNSLLKGSSDLRPAFLGMALAAPWVLLFWFARRAFYLQLVPGRALIGAALYSTLLLSGILALNHRQLLSPFSAFLIMGIGAFLTSILLLTRLRPAMSAKSTAVALTLREVVKRHWHYGRWALASALFMWIPWNIFYSVVARFLGLAEAGALRALLNLALPITQTYSAFSLLLLPHAARLAHEKGWESVKGQAWKIAGLFTLGSSAYWLLVCLFRGELIHFLYAGRYSEVVPLVPLVAIASVLTGAAMGPTTAIRAMRSPATVAAIYVGASLVALLVGIPACLAWGIRGAVFAILLSSIMAVLTGFRMLGSRNRQKQPLAPGTEPMASASASIPNRVTRREGR